MGGPRTKVKVRAPSWSDQRRKAERALAARGLTVIVNDAPTDVEVEATPGWHFEGGAHTRVYSAGPIRVGFRVNWDEVVGDCLNEQTKLRRCGPDCDYWTAGLLANVDYDPCG
jgi:hypothetical protein